MVFDWLAREGIIVFSWWLLVTLAGLAVVPLCTRLLRGLPDRGYTLSKALGLLLTGYVFWLFGSLGFLKNTAGSVMLAWLAVLILSLTIYFRAAERFDWRAWFRENWRVIVFSEILFALLLVGWAVIRAYQPEIRSTEKPMDMMFISSIIRSEAFPPNDGWLSGYSISYYYFGYVIAAMLAKITAVNGAVGLNMMVSLVFALAGLTIFGVVYNLARSRTEEPTSENPLTDDSPPRIAHAGPILAGLLAAAMVILFGNFHTLLVDIPSKTGTVTADYLQIWDAQAFTNPSPYNPNWNGLIGWFWPSRVLTDRDLDGNLTPVQPIDEFPQFSFLLADSHPHVMALPFVALALGLALNLLLLWREPTWGETIFYAFCVGALVFLNTWDGPIYILALVGVDALRRGMRAQGRITWADVRQLVLFGVSLLVLTGLFYLPFLVSFRSQASGLLPNIVNPTYFPQFFLMFGPFLLILIFFLVSEVRAAGERMNWKLGLQAAVVLLIGLLLVMLLLMLVGLLVPELAVVVMQFAQKYGGLGGALPLVLKRRWETLPTTLLLLIGLVMIIGRLFPRRPIADAEASREERRVVTYPRANGFALLVVAVGIGLTLVPEFFYLRDNFGVRINTIFKFYYQAWVVFSVASAYAAYTLLATSQARNVAVKAVFALLLVGIVASGLLYPIFGIHTHVILEPGRDNVNASASLSLDGGDTLVTGSDYASISCWEQQIGDRQVVVAEALGGAYNNPYATGRIPGLTGVPAVMGWQNHEGQWRGATYAQVAGTRPDDIPTLYKDLRWEVAQEIIERYGIDYIFYGNSERLTYSSVGEEKFREYLEPVCPVNDETGRVASVFYRVTDTALQTATN